MRAVVLILMLTEPFVCDPVNHPLLRQTDKHGAM